MSNEHRDADILALRERFLRSVNIVLDAISAEGIEHFRPTAKTAGLIKSLLLDDQERCFFVVAPYGSGKSLAATFALHLIENRKECRTALETVLVRLKTVAPDLASTALKRLSEGTKRGLAIPMHGHAESIAAAVKDATIEACRRVGLRDSVRSLARVRCVAAEDMPHFLNKASETWQNAGVDRVAIIWDEFGKHLESLISAGTSSDLLDLQVLAEYCARTKSPVVCLSVLMHQGLLRYASKLSQTARLEWAKVEGRFKTVQFVDTSKEIYLLVGELMRSMPTERPPTTKLREAAKALQGEGPFKEFTAPELTALLGDASPMSPVTLYLLPRVSARVAQNERTLFSFLYEVDLSKPVTPSDLYDYFSSQMHADISVGGTNKQWLQTESAIAKCSGDARAVAALKTACLLGMGLSGERAHASMGLLKLGLGTDAGGVIGELIRKSLLLHRRHTDSVTVWHGTDYDIRGKVEELKGRGMGALDVVAFLGEPSPPPVWKSSRYNADYGVTRYFKGEYVPAAALRGAGAETLAQSGKPLDGKVYYVLPDEQGGGDDARVAAGSVTHSQVLVCIARDRVPLADAVLEVACLQELQQDTEFVSQDPLVPVELEQMLDDAEGHLQRLLDRLVWPQPGGAEWFYRGSQIEITSPAALRAVLSQIMERVYSKTPVIRNELVVRHSLSKPMINARKKLIMGILEQTGRDNLGFLESEVNTPQASMYRTLLVNTGLYHRVGSGGAESESWRFADPNEIQDPGLREVWGLICAFFSEAGTGKSIQGLVQELQGKDFGVRWSVIPILLAAGYRASPSSVIILRNGKYLSDVLSSDFEELCAQPEVHDVRVIELTGKQRRYLREIVRLFAPDDSKAESDTADLLVLAHECFVAWKSALPPAAISAKGVNEKATAFQAVLCGEWSPDELFLDRLPMALMGRKSAGASVIEDLRSTIDELTAVVSRYQHDVESIVYSAFAVGKGDRGGVGLVQTARTWADSFPRAMLGGMPDLIAMRLFSMIDANVETDDRFVEGLCLLLVGKVLLHWDADTFERFAVRLTDLTERIERRAFAYARSGQLRKAERQLLAKLVEHRIEGLNSLLSEIQS